MEIIGMHLVNMGKNARHQAVKFTGDGFTNPSESIQGTSQWFVLNHGDLKLRCN
jgi:hypothetical protein